MTQKELHALISFLLCCDTPDAGVPFKDYKIVCAMADNAAKEFGCEGWVDFLHSKPEAKETDQHTRAQRDHA